MLGFCKTAAACSPDQGMDRVQGAWLCDMPPLTPDRRYIIVRGRLWRAANPDLSEAERTRWVAALMDARRAVKAARSSGDRIAEAAARKAVDRAKVALGERGPVWWDDGAPDLNRRMVKNTPYAGWFDRLGPDDGRQD